ncbi:MAG: MGMT family protein [Desulfurococcales archaeon]|nr:MGMT family protein [Desulfurococcales archaeon]
MIPCFEVRDSSLVKPEVSTRECGIVALKALLQLIPAGAVTTYCDIACLLGTSARQVGRLLRENDEPLIVPCHRVVRSDGGIGGYTFRSAPNPGFKERLLRLEGVKFSDGRVSLSSVVDLSLNLLGSTCCRKKVSP